MKPRPQSLNPGAITRAMITTSRLIVIDWACLRAMSNASWFHGCVMVG